MIHFFVEFSKMHEKLAFEKNYKKLLEDCDGKHFYNQQKIIHGDKILFMDSPKFYSMIMILFYSHPHKWKCTRGWDLCTWYGHSCISSCRKYLRVAGGKLDFPPVFPSQWLRSGEPTIVMSMKNLPHTLKYSYFSHQRQPR